ncbi:excalibur calcium-binding domain-containing protein [Actinomycetospora flava]|uniref:Excalibur calcium-binding domain-containing protein n=1 Tax=Actinomycetospora flava TaxID=3129232 RepID=A0ABU8M752_9PSEU
MRGTEFFECGDLLRGAHPLGWAALATIGPRPGRLWFRSPCAGVAAAADKNCDDFTSQAGAQAYFTANGGSATNNVNNLDADHDGMACDTYPYAPSGSATGSPRPSAPIHTVPQPTPVPSTSGGGTGSGLVGTGGTGAGSSASAGGTSGGADLDCPDFPSQAAAQAHLQRNSADPDGLDADRDGIACEDHFGQLGAGGRSSTRDDGSVATTSGTQVRVVPEGSADTGSS